MKFNDESTKTGICQDARFLLGFGVNDSVTYPNSDIARGTNSWYRRADNLIQNAVADWEFDDSNLTNLPTYTTTIVDSQADYEIPSVARTVEKVEVMGSDGSYVLIKPITKEMVQNEAMTEMYATTGLPEYYDLVGRSIILYPTPSTDQCTATDGLKIYVSRDIQEFNSTTTTREPGFDNQFHRILPLGCALDYANAKGMTDKVAGFQQQIALIEQTMKEFYSQRHNRDFKTKIRPKSENYV